MSYCIKCKKIVEASNEKEVQCRGGHRGLKGQCPKCGTTVYKMIGTKKR